MDLILEGFGVARIALTWKSESTWVRFIFLFPGGPGKAHAPQSTQEGCGVSDSPLQLQLIAPRCGVAPSPYSASSFCKGALTQDWGLQLYMPFGKHISHTVLSHMLKWNIEFGAGMLVWIIGNTGMGSFFFFFPIPCRCFQCGFVSYL